MCMSGPEESRRLFEALMTWAAASPKGVRGGGGVFPDLTLHHRPDPTGPEVQVRFIAMQVDGAPMIRVEYVPNRGAPPTRSDGAAVLRSGSAPAESPVDGSATCDACGELGTVGWIRYGAAEGVEPTVHRYCERCWAPEAAWHQAKYEDDRQRSSDAWLRSDGREPRPASGGFSMSAATWHQPLTMVREIERMMRPAVPPSAAALAELAAQIEAMASDLVGPMPAEVEAFIHRYRSGAG